MAKKKPRKLSTGKMTGSEKAAKSGKLKRTNGSKRTCASNDISDPSHPANKKRNK